MIWRIGELLIQKKFITWEQLEDALMEQRQSGELVGEILVRKGYIGSRLFFKVLAEQSKLRFVELSRTRINPEAVSCISGDFALRHRIVPIELNEGALTIGIPHPFHLWPQEEVESRPQVSEVRKVLCTPEDIEKTLSELYGASS